MKDNLVKLIGTKWFIPASVGVAAFSGGLVAGYVLGRKKGVSETTELYENDVETGNVSPQLTFDFDSSEDIDETKSLVLNPRMDPSTIIANSASFLVSDLELESSEDGEGDEGYEFIPDPDDNWNYEQELSTRTPDNPYVIHQDEFFADEMGYTQTTYTYFAGDDILVDETDVPVYGYPNIVGELKFGHGSRDENVVYVRNERLHTEYEILFSEGSYEIEVLGLQLERTYEEDDIKHSTVRFRME